MFSDSLLGACNKTVYNSLLSGFRLPGLPQRFHIGPDYILSIKTVFTCLNTHQHLVCELHPWATAFRTWLRITEFFAFLPSLGRYP